MGVGDKPFALGHVKVQRVSARAVLVKLSAKKAPPEVIAIERENSDKLELWVPHSQLHADSEIQYDYENAEISRWQGQLIITSWLAHERGYLSDDAYFESEIEDAYNPDPWADEDAWAFRYDRDD